MVSRRRSRCWAVCGWALLITACGTSFDPRSYLHDLRILAVFAQPSEVGPEQAVTLRPLVYVPNGAFVAKETWSFCPLTTGPYGGYQCIRADCEVPVQPLSDGTVQVVPMELTLPCLHFLAAEAQGSQTASTNQNADIPASLDVVFRYHVETNDQFSRDAIVRVPLWLRGPPPQSNQPPRFDGVDVEYLGRYQPASMLPPVRPSESLKFRVRIDPQSLDTYQDEANRQRLEDPVISYYATAGRFNNDRTNGVESENTWKAKKLEDSQTSVEFWMIARDQRGGQSVVGPLSVSILR